jgi:hypothetical protein
MASGWLRGTVKEVPAGDTVVIIGASKVVPPPEKRITLSSLVAPKLVCTLAAAVTRALVDDQRVRRAVAMAPKTSHLLGILVSSCARN